MTNTDSLTLTILGSGRASPNPGGNCSGYLLREGENQVLMDCGNGIVGTLREFTEPNQLDAVVISHLHGDHYFDIVPLYYGIRFGPPRPASKSKLVPMWVPPGGRNHFRRFGKVVSGQDDMFDDVFEVREYSSGGSATLAGLDFSFHPVQHYILSHAMRVRGKDGSLLVFSSDVGPCDALVEAALGADLFLCESAWMSRTDEKGRRGHMSAEEAGEAARAAGARRLVLTHCARDNGGPIDRQQRERASSTFDGPVELADEGRTFVVRGEGEG